MIYIIGDKYAVYDPETGTMTSYGNRASLMWHEKTISAFCNGKIYTYSASCESDGGDGYYMPYNLTEKDPTNGITNTIVSSSNGGIFFNDVIVCADKLYFILITAQRNIGIEQLRHIRKKAA